MGGGQVGIPNPGGMSGMGNKGGSMSGPPTGSGSSGGERTSETPEGSLTPINKVNRVRYLAVTTTTSNNSTLTIARHLPIAMRLIVDQSHVHDVLTAVANSRP